MALEHAEWYLLSLGASCIYSQKVNCANFEVFVWVLDWLPGLRLVLYYNHTLLLLFFDYSTH